MTANQKFTIFRALWNAPRIKELVTPNENRDFTSFTCQVSAETPITGFFVLDVLIDQVFFGGDPMMSVSVVFFYISYRPSGILYLYMPASFHIHTYDLPRATT